MRPIEEKEELRVKVYLKDADQTPVEVSTVSANADGVPLVSIEHDGHTLVISPDKLAAAMSRARIDERYPSEIDF